MGLEGLRAVLKDQKAKKEMRAKSGKNIKSEKNLKANKKNPTKNTSILFTQAMAVVIPSGC